MKESQRKASEALHKHLSAEDSVAAEFPADEYECCAGVVLKAADDVRFSKWNVDRAVRTGLRTNNWYTYGDYHKTLERAVEEAIRAALEEIEEG